MLQWITSIVFWWHPLVWISRVELHRLEEQCCDAEVMHRLPADGRAYASALLSASQWLGDHVDAGQSRHQPSLLAVPMSDITLFESFHRRIEMLPTLVYRPWTRRRMLAALLAAIIPLGFGLSASAEQDNLNSPTSQSTLVGHVTDPEGKPIVDAKVRVVLPTADLRSPVDTAAHREFLGKTDAKGNYSIEVIGIKSESSASIDILHPGHCRLVGTHMSGSDPNDVTLVPGKQVEYDATLPEALYFTGQVVDEAGEPIEGVLFGSSLETDTSSYGVETSVTDAKGRFSVYCYTPSFFEGGGKYSNATGSIEFLHDRYITARLKKLEDIEPTKRVQLRVEMQSGHSIAGTVNGADGTPVSGVVISILQKRTQRKGRRTDEDGHFRFDGLNDEVSTLRVVDALGKQKLIEDLNIDANNTEMTISLKSFDAPFAKTYSMLGMTIADVTEASNKAYDLRTGKYAGVMIVDPGTQSENLEIGELRPGYVFLTVGKESIKNTRELVERLVHEAKSPTTPPGPGINPSAWTEDSGDAKVRVIYNLDNEDSRGSNTQYMRLTPEDVAELEELIKNLPSN